MSRVPEFPQFRPIQLQDRDFIREEIRKYHPLSSEWSFTNLFIWRAHYGFQWAMSRDWLIILCSTPHGDTYALQPIGPSPRLEVTRGLLRWLREERGRQTARIERADERLKAELEGASDLIVEPTRDQFDYVYSTQDLITLAGRRYHGKRNHIKRFRRTYQFTYEVMGKEHLEDCRALAERWCAWRRCDEDLSLLGEGDAIHEALTHFEELGIQGGVILMEGELRAFALGELLNEEMAVVHIEKADPEVPGLYAMINQQFCEHCWQHVPFINREQDLGEPGLRKAKHSYHPNHLVEKFRVQLKG